MRAVVSEERNFLLSPSVLAIRVTSNKFPPGNVINTTGDVVGDSREEK